MMHSIPVLAADLPPIKFFVDSCKGCYCIPEKKYSVKYTYKIIEILNNYMDYKKLSDENKITLVNRWNWHKTEKKKLIELINMSY